MPAPGCRCPPYPPRSSLLWLFLSTRRLTSACWPDALQSCVPHGSQSDLPPAGQPPLADLLENPALYTHPFLITSPVGSSRDSMCSSITRRREVCRYCSRRRLLVFAASRLIPPDSATPAGQRRCSIRQLLLTDRCSAWSAAAVSVSIEPVLIGSSAHWVRPAGSIWSSFGWPPVRIDLLLLTALVQTHPDPSGVQLTVLGPFGSVVDPIQIG